MSDPSLSEIDFKNKIAWVWTTLNVIQFFPKNENIIFGINFEL